MPLLHIPHSSLIIPFYDGYLADAALLKEEMNLLTDWFTDELFEGPYPKIIAPFTRIFCDVERFADDSREDMAKHGMGMCYEKFDDGSTMRKVTPALREKIYRDYYRVHHQALETATAELLNKHGRVLIVDCHSFTDTPLKRDLNQDMPRPDFCIGTHTFHTPQELTDRACRYLQQQGYTVGINDPYKGTLIPMPYYKKDKRVQGIMIEVGRKLYMETSGGRVVKSAGFDGVKMVVEGLLGVLISF